MPKTKKPANLTTEQKAEAAALAAVGYFAKKRLLRSGLVDGATAVDLELSGTVQVGRTQKPVSLPIKGKLQVEPTQNVTSSVVPDAAHVIAHLVAAIPKARRPTVLAHIRKITTGGKIDAPPPDLVETVTQLFAELRASKPGTKAGAVAFRPGE